MAVAAAEQWGCCMFAIKKAPFSQVARGPLLKLT